MNLAVPASPSGPRALAGSGDGPASRHHADASEFAAALSGNSSERSGEAVGGSAPAKATKGQHIAEKLSRRIDGAKPDPASVEDVAGVAEALAEGGPPANAVPQADETLTVVRPEAPVVSAPVPPMTAPALPADQSRGESFPPHDLQGVRDAIAALGIDFPPRGERPTSLDDIIARVNTLAPKTARTSAPVPVDPPSAPAQPAEPELLASVPQDVLTAVKVVRQETHFQPAGQEVRRLLEMTTVTPDERILHVSLAAATETGRKGTGDRDRREQPIAVMRALDGAAPSMAAGETAKEANFASVGQQIADGVQRALASPSEPAASSRSVPQVDPAAQQVFAGPVRTIKLQLNPQSLGAVTIILTHRDAELSIKLEAELAETVGKVEQDRTALTAKLAGAGYAVGELTISRMATTAGGAGADAGARDSDPRQGAAAQHGAGGRSADQGAAASSHERAGRHAGTAEAAGDSHVSAAPRPAIGQVVAGVSYSGRFRPV